jgi:hypothetical protein
VWICAASAAEPARVKVLVLDLNVLDTSAPGQSAEGMKRLAQIVIEQVSAELGSSFQVLSSSDFTAMMGLDRQKQLLGCGEQANSCLAELSGALGAPLVVSGSLQRAGGKTRLDLKLMRTVDAVIISRQGAFLESDADVFTVVAPLAKTLAAVALGKEPPAAAASAPAAAVVAAPAASQGTSRSVPALIVTAVGAAAAIAGGAVLVVQQLDGDSLSKGISNGSVEVDSAVQSRGAIYSQRTIGFVLVGAGAAIAVGGLTWFLLSGSPAQHAGLAPVPGGAVMTWSGQW